MGYFRLYNPNQYLVWTVVWWARLTHSTCVFWVRQQHLTGQLDLTTIFLTIHTDGPLHFIHSFFTNPPINIHHSFTNSHFISRSLILFSSTTCFRCYPFLWKGYYNIIGTVLMIKRLGATLHIGIICLGVRLICLDVRLPIKVLFSHHT